MEHLTKMNQINKFKMAAAAILTFIYRLYLHEIWQVHYVWDLTGSRKLPQAGVKDGYSPKSGYFTAIISCSLQTVADRHRYAAYHNKQ